MNSLKTYYLIFLVLFLSGCKKDKPYVPTESDYHAIVKINGENIKNWIIAGSTADSLWGINFSHYINGLTYSLVVANFPVSQSHGVYRLHTVSHRDSISSTYYEWCCNEEPDQANKNYIIFEHDSLDNYMRLHLDTVKQEASGMMKATYINFKSPFDLLHIECDTFYCKYTKY